MNKYHFIVEIEAEDITSSALDKAFQEIEDLPNDEFDKKFTLVDLTNNKTFTGSELREILGVG